MAVEQEVTARPQDVALLPEPKFGDWLRGIYASESNPTRDGMYVRTIRRTGRMNPGKYYELTDGKGKFWQYPATSTERLDRANLSAALASAQAREEELRAEVARLTAYVRTNAGAEQQLVDARRQIDQLDERNERLAEALRYALNQNEHDMVLTGDEIRAARCDLSTNAAQPGETT